MDLLESSFSLTSPLSLQARNLDNDGWVSTSAPIGEYANLNALISELNAGDVPQYTLQVTESDVLLVLDTTTALFLNPTPYGANISLVSNVAAAFDLNQDEFGLVSSADSSLTASELGDVTKVAELLNTLFQFDAGSADEVLNTSIFAVTAKDDPTQTAIWAHRQSATNDATVDAIELYQLAVVHTTGDEFAAHDLYLQTLTV